MSKGVWLKEKCTCMTCHKCRNRARMAAIRAGTHTKYVAKGRLSERLAEDARVAKKARKEALLKAKFARLEAKKRA